jgi:protein-S-isoprenylcysteine O-methyltransferase Ste14
VVTVRGWIARGLYGALFVAGLPFLLVRWARATEDVVPLTVVHQPGAGLAVAAAGIALVTAGVYALIVHGRGLPMNAFPPPRFAREGVFGWIRHPIYTGFTLACAGVAVATGSASGLWLVTPVVALAAAALVFGFERPDLVRRFGGDATARLGLSLPRADDERPEPWHRVAVFLWILIPWMATWFAAQAIGRPPDAFETELPFERNWPVWQWTELLYVTAYIYVPITVLVARSGRSLRRLALSGAIATVIVTICWFTIPVVAENRPFVPANVFGSLLAFEQAHSSGVAAFPAFHVLWALIAATAWVDDARHGHGRWRAWLGVGWAAAIVVSCHTTGMHTVVDTAAAVLLYLPLREPARTWAWIRARTEAHANSWREWRFGPVRVINHGLYAGAAGAVGFIVMSMSLPADGVLATAWVTLCVLVGAGLWAQALEGSSVLLRPFGWYGGVIGAAVGAFTARWFGVETISMMAALAIAAPWIQALGRLRCLVQGCCHGGPAGERVGIRYVHRRSRVTQIAHLGGRPIHATPLYSIAGNLVIAVILLRLRSLGAPDVLVLGLYLMLGGIARFVEEGYRAEPQTPVIGGLHSYQWIAVASLFAGMWCTALPPTTATVGFTGPTIEMAIAACVAGAIAGAAMGIDLPGSNRRFSRLAPAD